MPMEIHPGYDPPREELATEDRVDRRGLVNKRFGWFFAASLAVAAIFVWWTAERADLELRENLLEQTRSVAMGVNVDRVRTLTGTEVDLDSSDYLRLKEQLARAQAGHDKCRFIYLMGRRADGQVFFFVDSEPVGSKDESPAGQIYGEASPEYIATFETATELVEGPVIDHWGTWISAMVPVTDPQTGELLAMLGMDIDAGTWKWDIASGVALPVGLMLTLLIVLGTGLVASQSQAKSSPQPVQRRLLIPLTVALLLLVGGFGVTLLHLQP